MIIANIGHNIIYKLMDNGVFNYYTLMYKQLGDINIFVD